MYSREQSVYIKIQKKQGHVFHKDVNKLKDI